jgi:hypothetical protein
MAKVSLETDVSRLKEKLTAPRAAADSQAHEIARSLRKRLKRSQRKLRRLKARKQHAAGKKVEGKTPTAS